MADISKTLSDMVFVAHHDAACYDGDDLISNWEIIDPSSSSSESDVDEDDVDYCFDDDDVSTDLHHQNDVDLVDVDVDDCGGGLVISPSIISSDLISDHPITSHVHAYALDVLEREKYESGDDDEDDDDDDDDDDKYDLDDELVPKCMSDRFGRERMRKLGKRAYPKMNKSKRLGYSYNRPGCVYGKHGLGLKHSI